MSPSVGSLLTRLAADACVHDLRSLGAMSLQELSAFRLRLLSLTFDVEFSHYQCILPVRIESINHQSVCRDRRNSWIGREGPLKRRPCPRGRQGDTLVGLHKHIPVPLDSLVINPSPQVASGRRNIRPPVGPSTDGRRRRPSCCCFPSCFVLARGEGAGGR